MADRYNHPTIHEQMLANRPVWHKPARRNKRIRPGDLPLVGSAQTFTRPKDWAKPKEAKRHVQVQP